MRFFANLFFLVFLMGCKVNPETTSSGVGSVSAPSSGLTQDSIQRYIDTKLKAESSPADKLFSFDGLCLDVSAGWLGLMKQDGVRSALQETSGVAYVSAGTQKIQRSPTHFFIAFNPGTSNEFILDATYSQFIADAKKLGLNPVFIGKTTELAKIFEKHSENLRVEVPFDEHTGKYDPQEVAELIYSFGRYSKNRKSMP